MARRLFRGRAFSENGWPYVDQGSCTWIRVPGAEHVSLQIQNGAPLQILRAFAADYHAYVEPLRDADSACWTPDNSVATSNHPGGTSMDLNWNGPDGRTFRYGISKERAFPGAMARALDELYDFYEGIMFCGGDWSIRDHMHHQLRAGTYDQKADRPTEKVNDFIRRKIRADGFSTYKRGGTPAPPPPVSKQDQYALAVMAEGRRRGITPRGIQIAFSVVFVESNWKMYANSKVPESLKLPHDAVGSDHDSVGLFQQRCPMWGPAEVLMDPTKSAGLFYDRLAKMDYNNPSRLPGDFAADVQRPAAQYRGRYQERMGDAVALYNRLAVAPPAQGDDELSAEAERMIREMYAEWSAKKKGPSRAFLAEDGSLIESPLGFIYNIDGNVWDIKLSLAYLFDVELAVEVVEQVANNGVYKGSWASEPFNAWLNQFGQQYCQGLVAFKKALVSKLALSNQRSGGPVNVVNGPSASEIASAVAAMLPAPDNSLHEENARLREELARLQADTKTVAVYEPDPGRTTGQSAGAVIDSVTEFVNRATQMTPQELEAVQRGLSVMQLSQNGTAK